MCVKVIHPDEILMQLHVGQHVNPGAFSNRLRYQPGIARGGGSGAHCRGRGKRYFAFQIQSGLYFPSAI